MKLLPCPFCKDEMMLKEYNNFPKSEDKYIKHPENSKCILRGLFCDLNEWNTRPHPDKGLIEWPEKKTYSDGTPRIDDLAIGFSMGIDACIAAYQAAQPVKTWTAEDFAKIVKGSLLNIHARSDLLRLLGTHNDSGRQIDYGDLEELNSGHVGSVAQAIADLVNGGK